MQNREPIAQSLHTSFSATLIHHLAEHHCPLSELCVSVAILILVQMKNRRRHVVMLRSAVREVFYRRKYPPEELLRRPMTLRGANGPQPLDPKTLPFGVERVRCPFVKKSTELPVQLDLQRLLVHRRIE
jgi:hypothetical protein